MAWTYSGDPASSAADAVRFEVGDTDESDQLAQDGEVAYALQEEGGNTLRAAARVAEAIAARLGRKVYTVDGSMALALQQKAASFREAADRLRRRAGGNAVGAPRAGGTTTTDPNAFRVGKHTTE